MPTIIVIDTSPSMNSLVKKHHSPEPYKPVHVATSGLRILLDHIANQAVLEFVAMVTYSAQLDILTPFTRDLNIIKSELPHIKLSDKFNAFEAMKGVEQYILVEWGSGTPCNVVLVVQDSSVNLMKHHMLPFTFPGNLFICSLGPEVIRKPPLPVTDNINFNVHLFQPEIPVTSMSIHQIFSKIGEKYYASWIGQIVCGNLSSRITLSPNPEPCFKVTDFDYNSYNVDSNLEICGFIELQHLASPAAISRHLVLPFSPPITTSRSHHRNPSYGANDSDDDSQGEGYAPNFCVLLHGALKVKNMAALVYVGHNWYGVLFSWADSKKKSTLMLSLLEPGREPVPWLGDLNNLTIPIEAVGEGESFPIKPSDKKSYAQNCVAWIKQAGIQSDIQKILRHARKIPEKTQQFYKELNRVRRTAICLGFLSLIDGLAAILEKECTLLPGTAHPACALQLTHAAGILREPYSRDHKYTILPMKMSF